MTKKDGCSLKNLGSENSGTFDMTTKVGIRAKILVLENSGTFHMTKKWWETKKLRF